MMVQTKLVRDGNSWSIRLPKMLLKMADIEPGESVALDAKTGQITIYSKSAAHKITGKNSYELAKQDARDAWDEAFEQVWLEIFGTEE